MMLDRAHHHVVADPAEGRRHSGSLLAGLRRVHARIGLAETYEHTFPMIRSIVLP
jgi:hypothetical protein